MKANPEEVAKIISTLPRAINPGNYEGFQPAEETVEPNAPVIIKSHQVVLVNTDASEE